MGDAGGLARDYSGEGIGPAVRSAVMAAEAVLAWKERGEGLEAYAVRISRTFGSGERGFAEKAIQLLPNALLRAVARTLCGNAWLRRRLVLEGAFGIG